jgi:hypothetical protein
MVHEQLKQVGMRRKVEHNPAAGSRHPNAEARIRYLRQFTSMDVCLMIGT